MGIRGPDRYKRAKQGEGRRGQPTFETWRGMHIRCYQPTFPTYAHYGGRGIVVCERWHVFENFVADMGERQPGMSLDRIDNDRGYEPSNCRWATASEQAKNKRKTHWIEIDGKRMSPMDAAAITGIPLSVICKRIYRGWPRERLFLPVRAPR